MTIQEIKDYIDIVEVVSTYTELSGRGNRLRAKPNPIREGGDFDVYQDTQKFYDQGTGESGDVIDFIEKVENLNRSEALSFLSEKYIGGSNITTTRPLPKPRAKPVKKNNDLLQYRLEQKTKAYLNADVPKGIVNLNRLTNEKFSMVEVDGISNIRVAPIFEKLLEGYLIPGDERFAKYLFDNIIGYDRHYHCPIIVLRDESEKVVGYVRYRPQRDGKPLMQGNDPMKYKYMSNAEKPDSNYLFPLQAQMFKMAKDQGYCYVGEGLKNAINASLLGIPFMSIEGAGNIKPELITFLKSNRMKDIVMIGALDGDQVGETAYKKISAEIPMPNEFDFNSGRDFTDFLKEIR